MISHLVDGHFNFFLLQRCKDHSWVFPNLPMQEFPRVCTRIGVLGGFHLPFVQLLTNLPKWLHHFIHITGCYQTFHFWQFDGCGMVSHFRWVKSLFISSSVNCLLIFFWTFSFSIRLSAFFILIYIIVNGLDFFIYSEYFARDLCCKYICFVVCFVSWYLLLSGSGLKTNYYCS